MDVFGDVLLEQGINVTFEQIQRLIERPFIAPRYRLSVLTPNEMVDYVIPNSDIVLGSISYSENYQSGQRRSLSVSLVNVDGRYTPGMNAIWVNTRFRFDVGLQVGNEILWFPKGVYILGNVDLTRNNSEKTVTYQLLDKFAIFEGKTGTLETAYEVEVGSTIEDAIRGVQNFALGNGYILDYKNIIIDPSFSGQKTQSTIRCEEGDNLGSVIDALATQLSAEYYYNTVGNLCFYPINETVNDDVKPIIWTFPGLGRDLHNLSLSYQNEEIVNIVKVVGDNIDNGIYSAVVSNNNPASPICVERVGRRMQPTYTEANIWSDDLAHDLAAYYLRKASFVSVGFTCNVSFNPILTVNNICEVEDEFLQLYREKLLITSISFTSESGLMSVQFSNTSDLPTDTAYIENR